MQTEEKRKLQMPMYPLSEPTAVPATFCSARINLLCTFSLQMWDETFQRVTNEQEIYEGLPPIMTTKIQI